MIERKQASRSGGKEEGEISTNLQTETGLAPVPPLGVVVDGVAGPQTNPLRDGTVLALGFSKLLLGAETLVARHLEDLSRRRAEKVWSGDK